MGETAKKTVDLDTLRHKEILTPAEATALGYFHSVKAASAKRYRGNGPAFIHCGWGTRVYYRKVDLEAWVERRRKEFDRFLASG